MFGNRKRFSTSTVKKNSHLDAQPLEGGKLDWARQDLLGFRIQLEEDNVEEGGHEQNRGGQEEIRRGYEEDGGGHIEMEITV